MCAMYARTIKLYDLYLERRKQTCVQIMAEVMGAEAAIVRIQFVSGTHAIATALFSVLRCMSLNLLKPCTHST